MRITISGAQSTGKTTLINALFSFPEIKNRFYLKNETTRNVLRDKLGIGKLAINEDGNDSTQLLICSQHLANYVAGEKQDTIYDRSALDGYVYTTYLFKNNKVQTSTWSISYNLFKNLIYDVTIYIKPEIPIVNDGERSTNLEFYQNICSIFDREIKSIENLEIVSGTVEERVQQVFKIIQKYDKKGL